VYLARFRRPSGNAGRGGFSLLETMIAISVLMIAVLSAVSSQVTSVNLLRTNRESNAAMTDLERAMEALLLEETLDEIVANNPAGVPLPAFAGLNLPNETVIPTYPGVVGGVVTDPLEIVVNMTWSDWRGRQRSLQLATMRAR